jgi:hypothetical protein
VIAGFLVISFEGPIAISHLHDTEHTVFRVGLTEVRITRIDPDK